MRSSLAAALLLLLAAPAPAPAGPPLAHREVLPNGLVLVVAERPAIPVVVVQVLLRAGSARDPAGAAGLANFTAELLTRGTVRRTSTEIDQAIEFVGGSLGADASRDGVTVGLAVLRKDLGLGLDLLADVLREPTFPEDELRRSVGEVQAAIRRADENPESVAGRELAPLLFPGHPYAHPIMGTVASVGALTRERVVAFHREHYRPAGAVVAVVGAITVAEARRELAARLASWASPVGAPADVPAAPARPPAQERVLVRELTQATAFLGAPAVPPGHPDYFPLVVANYVLGGGSASRLYSRIREDGGLAYSVGSTLAPARHGPSLVVSVQTRNDAVAEALGRVRAEMARLGRVPVGAAELALARSYLVGSFPLRLDTSAKVARYLLSLEEHGLGLDYPDTFRDGVGRVTAADVRRVAARYLDPALFSTVVVKGPAAAK